jgi:hypothetical protein
MTMEDELTDLLLKAVPVSSRLTLHHRDKVINGYTVDEWLQVLFALERMRLREPAA